MFLGRLEEIVSTAGGISFQVGQNALEVADFIACNTLWELPVCQDCYVLEMFWKQFFGQGVLT